MSHIVPGRLDGWDGAAIQRITVSVCHLDQHGATDEGVTLATEAFGLDLLGNPRTENAELLNKIWSEHIIRKRVQLLEHDFLFNRSDKCVTVSVFEEMFDQTPDPVLVFDGITTASLLGQAFVEVLFRRNLIANFIFQLETEVSEHPE